MEPTAATAAGWSWYNAVRSLVVGERYDVALRALDDELERARSRGALIDVGGVLAFRAELFVHLGDLANAEVDARTLHEIAVGYGWVLGLGTAAWVLGEVLIERGELDEAEALLFGGRSTALRRTVPHVYSNVWVLLGARAPAAARRAAPPRPSRSCASAAGGRPRSTTLNPAVLPWRSAARAWRCSTVGETAEARWLAIDELGRAHAFGGRRAIGIALRAAARVEGGAEEIRLLREAATVLEESRGAARARAGRVPRSASRCTARAIAEGRASRCAARSTSRTGAARRCSRTRRWRELRATGARPRRRLASGAGALTPSERRIAELAAAGAAEPRDRRDAVRDHGDGRVPPAQRVPQARHHVADPARRGA